MRSVALILAGLVGGGFFTACNRAVVVGSKNFTEQVVLGEMIALLLEGRGVPVDRKLNLGGSFICHRALASGRLDVYVEYTGTALTAILKEPVLHDEQEVFRRVRSEYRQRFGLEWGPPLGFDNTYALAMRSEQAERLDIRCISDLAPHVDTIRTGFGHEFLERDDGYRGFTAAYDLDFAIPPSGMELGLIYQALAEGEVDLVAGSSTDALIEKLDLRVLQDDRKFFPPYDAAPVYRPDTARAIPALVEVLETLGGQIDEATMRRLNMEVDVDRISERQVALEFLVERGWLEPPHPP